MLKILWMITGGRPMRLVENTRFLDQVTGRPVHLYEDRLDRTYLAEHSWSLFRVGVNPTVDDWGS